MVHENRPFEPFKQTQLDYLNKIFDKNEDFSSSRDLLIQELTNIEDAVKNINSEDLLNKNIIRNE